MHLLGRSRKPARIDDLDPGAQPGQVEGHDNYLLDSDRHTFVPIIIAAQRTSPVAPVRLITETDGYYL
jgi:hypothetical protein